MDEIQEHDLKIVKEACNALMMHFDTVQIFTTRFDPSHEGTTEVKMGDGNWYARYGQIIAWVDDNSLTVKEEE